MLMELAGLLDGMRRERILERIWSKDHTVWHPKPDEIADRLGWLDLVRLPPQADAEIDSFVEEARAEGVRDVVLLGMGGSSLGAEALRSCFGGPIEGFPRLHVLDSTHPDWVRRVRAEIDPASTLFLVASKSGTTAEVHAFYEYFLAETVAVLGEELAGGRFAAITDPGTPLVELAKAKGFRRVFTNPPDIGGRFSVLSRFGLVPAALSGIPVKVLQERAYAMARRCTPESSLADNPGATLGAILGAASHLDRPFLTLLTSPNLSAFGLWIEQLLAESTGKKGVGILPIAGEPQADAERYGKDRLFVVLRDNRQADAGLDEFVRRLCEQAQPLVDLKIDSLADLGGEFIRWEIATAVAGHLLGVHPFDQPNVQDTKVATVRALASYTEHGRLPEVGAVESDLAAALAAAKVDRPALRYVALMAYADESAEFEDAVLQLRRRLLRAHGIATTFGYGPRFLHSTGQLHKGGFAGGLFVQLIAKPTVDVDIPGAGHSFGTLLRAQADGDLQALRGNKRRVVRIELGSDAAAGLRRLTV